MNRSRPKPPLDGSHRFLDEAGDPAFYGKGKVIAIGQPGVSLAFSLGMVTFLSDLKGLRQAVVDLQRAVGADEYLSCIPSVQKKIAKGGFHFHAPDDPPEVRERMFKFIKSCTTIMKATATATGLGRNSPPKINSARHCTSRIPSNDVKSAFMQRRPERR